MGGRPKGNAFGVDMNGGCHIQDMIDACTRMGRSGTVTSCLAHTTAYLERIGAIGAADGQAIEACAGN